MSSQYLKIVGGRKLEGVCRLSGAKNAVLPLMAAATLTEEDVGISDCPFISDVSEMTALLETLGVRVNREGRELHIYGKPQLSVADGEHVGVMRSSMLLLGAMLSAIGEVRMPLPGGCRIGSRPLDIHLDGLKRLGAEVNIDEEGVTCRADRLKGADIYMRYPSVGATENLILASALAEGTTVLYGAAREPEISSLAEGIRRMGGRVTGETSGIIRIDGVKKLHGGELAPVKDRIVAGTILTAAALTGGDVTVCGLRPDLIASVIDALISREITCECTPDSARIRSTGNIAARDIKTLPYPGFPTDMQPQMLAALCYAKGESRVTENVFEHRFSYTSQLIKAGADISVRSNVATVTGGRLVGADMYAEDLRGGAGLIIAALKAEGVSRIFGLNYIDRGYERIEDTLSSLGADISRAQQGV